MATRPPSTDPRDDAFIREVDEAYREDELKRFFQRYGRWILLAVGLGLAGLGAALWWKAERIRRVDALSEQFTVALDKVDSGSTTEALKSLEEIGASDNPSYRSLAAFSKAGIAQSGGDTAKAAALLKAVADDPKAAQPFRDAATIKYVRLQFDTMAPNDVLAMVKPYLEGDSPWFPVAGELAALAHVKAGAPDKAGPLFLRIASDEKASPSLRARSEQMAASLGQDVTKLVATREAEELARAEAAAKAATNQPAAEAGVEGAQQK